ncbi:unnamed protein product [Lathyrus sativus]|nr:unnamed protein product [Lathyrus sativus]
MVNIIIKVRLIDLMVDANQIIMMAITASQRKHGWLILHVLFGILKPSTIFSLSGDQANLYIVDLTDSLKPMSLLPYMQSYKQADIKLLHITLSICDS